ncbi:MAG: hypothetical protein IKN54_04670 [Lachnospiraceae bacterium]|nr:hypothetical protein [Lachnospiraceae bacterium]
MSREVEVQNIQMTATVPEDIQLSLGAITNSSASAALAYSTGYLTGETAGTPQTDFDWSNTADISHYYSFGKLIPASSDTGASIFFTPDANGIGQTVKVDAKYYTAVSALTPVAESAVGNTNSATTLNATSHINTSTAWTGTPSEAWNDTNDDGYYIDIPVWLRTSCVNATNVSVKAYVKDLTQIPQFGANSTATATGKELYKAVRVAILTDAGAVAAASGGNLLPVADGDNPATSGNDTSSYSGASVLDWYSAVASNASTVSNPSMVHGGAVNAVSTQGSTEPTYTASPVSYTAGTSVATLAARGNANYGTPTKVIVRVWLEGEDPDCYNETAGQDWSVNLMFEKIES